MNFLNTILGPLEWVVAAIMVVWHAFFDLIGLNPDGGAAWAFSIVGLVVTIRVILIPLFVKQIKSSRAMQMIAPELKAIQAKYKGKKDQASREAMSRETMELYSTHRTNPFSSCLPMLVQAPIFFALFRVLNGLATYAQPGNDGHRPAHARTRRVGGASDYLRCAAVRQVHHRRHVGEDRCRGAHRCDGCHHVHHAASAHT